MASSVEFAELDPMNFGADVGGKFFNLSLAAQEVGKFRVRILAMFISLKILVWWICHVVPVCIKDQ